MSRPPAVIVMARRSRRRPLAPIAALVCAIGMAGGVFVGAGALLSTPAVAPHHADAVVVLGGDPTVGGRYALGVELLTAGYARRLVLVLPSAAQIADAAKRSIGVDALDDPAITGSWGEAVAVHAYLRGHGLQSALVVSDPPHMLRLQYAWGANFRGSPERFSLVATRPPWWSAWRWWQSPQGAAFVQNEVPKLLGYIWHYGLGLPPVRIGAAGVPLGSTEKSVALVLHLETL